LFLALRYQNYTGKAIFMPPSIGVGIAHRAIMYLFECTKITLRTPSVDAAWFLCQVWVRRN
jgi:hypothetical protein